ncbi:uncharacterized protein LOC129242545 [Anastrepha obliqua]|uniref:uncharacterized protein LOC129242545 n=1 Tax=Anastrepha obliqua TaxID=95512 RepID=UPI0024096ABA|nr:uncharacterized protein LOC129242545 [Anastrepha obliqua]
MMFVPQHRYNSNTNNCYRKKLSLQLAMTELLLLVQFSLCLGVFLLEAVDAAEPPAELLLEGVRLLKSMEHAQEKQQQHQQYHQKAHLLHAQAKRFPFDTNSADVDLDGMQAPVLSPADDISRFERELFLQSAIDDAPLTDDVVLPLEPDTLDHADLMERSIDYNQHQSPSSMWLQQHNNNGGDHKTASSTFSKMHHPYQQQKPHQKHTHHMSGDTTSTNSATPASPAAEPQRNCAIVISTKLTGVCQAMAPIGTACVAGDYMDVYNQDCM